VVGAVTMTPDSQLLPTSVSVLRAVARERIRQEELRAQGRFPYTAASPDCPEHLRLAALTEEFGEVGRAICERDIQQAQAPGLVAAGALLAMQAQLRTELVELAAVAVAWAEALDG
jgi:hypothetical protein